MTGVYVLQLKMACFPNLESVSEVAVEVVTQTGPSPKPQEEKDTNQVCVYHYILLWSPIV